MMHPHDERFMRAALALARRGLGRTWPNPSVAALVVDERHDPPLMLGRGRTAPGGRPHAEANALEQAGALARGATLYVILEPCAERSKRVFGPSCTEAILESGVARVVIGAPDPSPFAGGEGTKRLRAAGLDVVVGVLEPQARTVTQGHVLRVSRHRPFVTLKIARTEDGFAATADRRPLAITGEESRAFVHRLRSVHDAIATGIGTVLADDPRLDVRLPGMAEMSPLRVVFDTSGRMPSGAALLAGENTKLLLTAEPSALERLRSASVEVVPVPRLEQTGRLDLAAALGALAGRGITRLMVEAGPELANAFAEAGFIDEAFVLTGPKSIGRGLPAIGPALARWLDKADSAGQRRCGVDLIEHLVGRNACSPAS